LISAEWLRAEAARQGLAPSAAAVSGALSERREANGGAEFGHSLRMSGQTVADVELEIEAELAASAIRHKVAGEAPEVTQAQVVDYYRSHRHEFRLPEVRAVDLVENLPSAADATALVKRVGIGRAFASKALHEKLQRNRGGSTGTSDIESVTDAIFVAAPGVASRPMSLNHRWTVFVVRKITPASFESLATVRPMIVRRLAARHRAQAVSGFASEFRRRWTTRTRCRVGYVVQGCIEYRGVVNPHEEWLSID